VPLMDVLAGLDLSALGYLVDLDGTLVSGGKPLPWARELLSRLGGRCVIVSNDAEHTSRQLARMLNMQGLRVPEANIVLAGECAIRLVAAERPGARVLLLASTALRRYAMRLGLHLTADNADIVLVGRDRGFSYKSIELAAGALHRGASLIVANPDGRHPAPDGSPVPETGALAAAILAAAGQPPYRVVGKPRLELFRAGLARLGCAAGNAVMIGDNPETDGEGASAAGMKFFLIRHS
jgi:HAD superfamily hydrolase (TIGR01450 family)